MKPKLFKKTNLYGNVYWVCKSKTHEAYGDTPTEAYQLWDTLKTIRYFEVDRPLPQVAIF